MGHIREIKSATAESSVSWFSSLLAKLSTCSMRFLPCLGGNTKYHSSHAETEDCLVWLSPSCLASSLVFVLPSSSCRAVQHQPNPEDLWSLPCVCTEVLVTLVSCPQLWGCRVSHRPEPGQPEVCPSSFLSCGTRRFSVSHLPKPK